MISFFPVLAFALCALALWLGRKGALALGYADRPGGRKTHDAPVPPIGGLAIIPVFILVSVLAGYKDFLSVEMMAGLLLILAMGAVDDVRPIKPFVKLTLMVWTACYVVIFGETQVGQLGNIFGFGMVEVGFLSKGFSIMCLVLLMNSINMMDGVDGLAGGFCALFTAWLMAVCAFSGQWMAFGALSVLLGCLLSFLAFNARTPWRKSASVFLGDAGALALGLLLGWFAIHLGQGDGAVARPMVIVWVIAVPVIDAFGLFIARSIAGQHPFYPDRRHLHHRFLDCGVPPGLTTVMMLGLTAICAAIASLAQVFAVPDYILFYGWMALFAAHTAAIMHPRGYDALVARIMVKSRD